MQFSQIPSLKLSMFTKVAICLWAETDVKELATNFRPPFSMENQREKIRRLLELEDKVLEKVSKLPLPQLLKKELSYFISAIGLEMDAVYSNSYFFDETPIEIFWTPEGNIDVKKMAEDIVRNEDVNCSERFKLACTFCLEDSIRYLWFKLSLEKESYEKIISSAVDKYPFILISYWAYLLSGEIHKFYFSRLFAYGYNYLDFTHEEILFKYSAEEGIELATKYFFQKLSSEAKEKLLVETAINIAKTCSDHHAQVLFYLLSVMSEKQQIEVFKNKPIHILRHLFNRSRQDFFLKMSPQIWSMLTLDDYYYLLTTIRKQIASRCRDYDYQMLFKVIWKHIPNAYKKKVINQFLERHSLLELFEVLDEQNMKLFLEHAIVSIDEIAFNCKGRQICKYLMYFRLWDLFRFFIERCCLSRDSLIKFEEQLKQNVYTRRVRVQSYMMSKSLEIVNEFIQKCNKRSSGDEEGAICQRNIVVKEIYELNGTNDKQDFH